MINALTLLLLATQLLTVVANTPNVPQEVALNAINTAYITIEYANKEIARNSPVTLKKEFREITVSDPMINKSYIQGLLSLGYEVIKGELPDDFYKEY